MLRKMRWLILAGVLAHGAAVGGCAAREGETTTEHVSRVTDTTTQVVEILARAVVWLVTVFAGDSDASAAGGEQ